MDKGSKGSQRQNMELYQKHALLLPSSRLHSFIINITNPLWSCDTLRKYAWPGKVLVEAGKWLGICILGQVLGCWWGRKKAGVYVSVGIRELWVKGMTKLVNTCLIADSAEWSKEAVCDTLLRGGVGGYIQPFVTCNEGQPLLTQIWTLTLLRLV